MPEDFAVDRFVSVECVTVDSTTEILSKKVVSAGSATNDDGRRYFKYEIMKLNYVLYETSVAILMKGKSQIHILWGVRLCRWSSSFGHCKGLLCPRIFF